MKKITFAILLLLSFPGFSQEPYTNYWDATSEWRYISGGWSGFYGFTTYTTSYFDGYEVVDGISYWKEYTHRTEIRTYMNGSTVSETILYPEYILTREDAAGNFYRRRIEWDYEVLNFSNQQIIDAELGQVFPAQGAGCNVESIEINYLGTRPLKRVKGSITGNNAGTLEGVGVIGNNCAMGIEFNGGLNCYKKQNVTLQFGTVDCASNLFPSVLRTGLGTADYPAKKAFGIYPNPTNGIFKINMPSSIENAHFEIYAMNGLKISEGNVASEETIDTSSFSSGVYLIKISTGSISENLRIIKN